jgi:predicted N-acyltransferase
MDDGESRQAKVMCRIADIPAKSWDACANPDPARFNPFVSHAFLNALEAAGTTGPEAGWMPQHIVLERPDGRLEALMPLYAKSHSRGEYVFDHAFADAYHRAGGRYYPKLQCAVPFTPVPGPRLLVAPDANRDTAERTLIAAALTLAEKTGSSSLHITFATQEEWERLGEIGLLQRTGQQFHWTNRGYASFGDFLSTLASRKRKMVRKERAEATRDGIAVRWVTGADITETDWDTMYEFYIDTGLRKWGRPYLNRAFFSELGRTMADRCLLVFADRAGRPIAAALHLIGGDCLYGRYWGATEHVPCLHFELCYYQAIDYAIAHGLQRIEAGAQGEHKLARGYDPVTTYSVHWFADEGLAAGVQRYLADERRAVAESNRMLAAFAPYRKALSQEQD